MKIREIILAVALMLVMSAVSGCSKDSYEDYNTPSVKNDIKTNDEQSTTTAPAAEKVNFIEYKAADGSTIRSIIQELIDESEDEAFKKAARDILDTYERRYVEGKAVSNLSDSARQKVRDEIVEHLYELNENGFENAPAAVVNATFSEIEATILLDYVSFFDSSTASNTKTKTTPTATPTPKPTEKTMPTVTPTPKPTATPLPDTSNSDEYEYFAKFDFAVMKGGRTSSVLLPQVSAVVVNSYPSYDLSGTMRFRQILELKGEKFIVVRFTFDSESANDADEFFTLTIPYNTAQGIVYNSKNIKGTRYEPYANDIVILNYKKEDLSYASSIYVPTPYGYGTTIYRSISPSASSFVVEITYISDDWTIYEGTFTCTTYPNGINGPKPSIINNGEFRFFLEE